MKLNWRPIRSAPKDGTMVLLAEWPGDGRDGVVWWGRWVDVPQENARGPRIADRKHDPMWVASYAAIYTSGTDDAAWHLKPIIVFSPTHWMPTPKPPIRRRRA
jgi:hypothetical protein